MGTERAPQMVPLSLEIVCCWGSEPSAFRGQRNLGHNQTHESSGFMAAQWPPSRKLTVRPQANERLNPSVSPTMAQNFSVCSNDGAHRNATQNFWTRTWKSQPVCGCAQQVTQHIKGSWACHASFRQRPEGVSLPCIVEWLTWPGKLEWLAWNVDATG